MASFPNVKQFANENLNLSLPRMVKDYEDKHIRLPEVDPIEAIKLKMEELGLKAKDLEQVIGTKGHVSSILSGRRELTLKTARKLKEYLHLPAEIFMHRHAG